MARLGLLTKLTDSSNNRGKFGEMIVSSIFDNRYFGNEEHYLVNDLIIEYNGSTHQIDHIAIYKTGIFCIETKNLSGLIIGDNLHSSWMQIVNKRKYDFMNPIMQNEAHIKALQNLLNMQENIYSLVIFIKGNKPKEIGYPVINLNELRETIKEFPNENELISLEMQNIYSKLIEYKERSGLTTKVHIENIKEVK